MPGWLGPDTIEAVMRKVHGEAGYTCHMSVSSELAGLPEDEAIVDIDNIEQCAGALMHANKTHKIYRNPELREHQERVKDIPILGKDFSEHHSVFGRKLKCKRKRKKSSRT